MKVESFRQKILIFLYSMVDKGGANDGGAKKDLPEEIREIVNKFAKGEITSWAAFVRISDCIGPITNPHKRPGEPIEEPDTPDDAF